MTAPIATTAPRMRITMATAMGTCFGVQDAIDLALGEEFRDNLTVVGQLVHNPQTVQRLLANGVKIVERDQVDQISTKNVMITAHGSADSTKTMLSARGFTVFDATCPLVIRLHKLARFLERKGFTVVIVGERKHVEVQGVVGNLSGAIVLHDASEVGLLKGLKRIGVVSQTTNRMEHVQAVVAAIQAMEGIEEVRFIDTICQPVKERQQAIHDLARADIDLGIVIGGKNSANTRKLKDVLVDGGIEAHHIEGPADLQVEWFAGKRHVGITAGTSTPQDVIEAVHEAVREIAARQ